MLTHPPSMRTLVTMYTRYEREVMYNYSNRSNMLAVYTKARIIEPFPAPDQSDCERGGWCS